MRNIGIAVFASVNLRGTLESGMLCCSNEIMNKLQESEFLWRFHNLAGGLEG